MVSGTTQAAGEGAGADIGAATGVTVVSLLLFDLGLRVFDLLFVCLFGFFRKWLSFDSCDHRAALL
jgi:hypothetical protein